jgi:hypothetical protein
MTSPTDAPPQPDDALDDEGGEPEGPAEEAPADGAPPDGPATAEGGRPSRTQRTIAAVARVRPETWVTLAVVAVSTGFVLAQLQPDLLVRNTTPAGGDMGAHVWGPAYMRDELLPQGRLTGWTPDWYAGFPAYQFYMVVPSLLIVALDVVLPYGIAFKLVSVSGMLALPAAAWAFGRLSGTRFPTPAVMAVGATLFLFDRTYTIYGGNMASTLAGEFAFSISTSVALVYLGVVAKGLRTGRYRWVAALLLGLTVLCHLIPAIFALVGTGALLLVHRNRLANVRWAAPVLVVGSAITAFWVLPFWWQRTYMNDMGWEKLAVRQPGQPLVDWGGVVGDGSGGWIADVMKHLVPSDLRWLVALALVGVAFSFIRRIRLGAALTLMTAAWWAAFVVLPQGRLWNARLLPFLYLGYFLLAAIGISETGRTVADWVGRRLGERAPLDGVLARRALTAATAGFALAAMLVIAGMPLGVMPFGSRAADGTYSWGPLETQDRSFLPDWARWNYSGYEDKASYREYHDIVQTMADVGDERGCGRAMWEYEADLDRYGTPMALMLLPYWTDGCIGSMEGLFFESSATTPYHFLNQSELSVAPSSAMRDLDYQGLDLDLGVQHLQLLGVRYYLATSQRAIDEADQQPDLTPIATSGPWQVYEVADSDLVVPLENQPAVVEGLDHDNHAWLGPAEDWYLDPERWDTFIAADGPDVWERIEVGDDPAAVPVDPVEVSDVETANDRISFSVSEPGTPVLVRASYFPNWHVSGAEGPYRVAPNLMVVVPTDEQVTLEYGYEPIDWVAWLVTGAGIAGVVVLWRLDRRRRPDEAAAGSPVPAAPPAPEAEPER